MRHVCALTLLLALFPLPSAAACYADYKAKRDDPLRLHYGVIDLPDPACSDPQMAAREIARRLEANAWQLLSVQGTFDESGLDERRASAGQFFLRF